MLEFNLLHNIFIRPPQVRTYTFTSSICHIYLICFRIVIGLCFIIQAYPQIKPNVIRVPQTKGLPPTSFRFHLAMDTLVLGYMPLALSAPITDFHRLVYAHAGRTYRKEITQLNLNYLFFNVYITYFRSVHPLFLFFLAYFIIVPIIIELLQYALITINLFINIIT